MAGGGGGESELNLVPYMDIMVNLIMFMIVVTAYIIELREAPVLAPSYTQGTGSTSPENKPKPYISVAISTKGFAILGSTPEVRNTELLRQGDAYPYQELTQALRGYKSEYSTLQENLVVTADGVVPYKTLVATMDAARSDGSGPLFPGVTLGLAVAGR